MVKKDECSYIVRQADIMYWSKEVIERELWHFNNEKERLIKEFSNVMIDIERGIEKLQNELRGR